MQAVPEVAAAVAAADRQHGGRLGPSAGRRVRPVQHGRPLAVPDDRLSQPSAAVPGVSRLSRRAEPARGSLEAGAALVPQVRHAAEPEADRAEVAAAHRPHPTSAGDVPQGEVRPHRPRSRTSSSPRRSISGSGSTATRACRCRPTRAWRSTSSRRFTRMYDAFERDRDLIGPGQFCEVRYEDLVADPIEQMRRVYERAGAGRFRGGPAGDRGVFRRPEGLQDEPLSDHARDARRDHPPLGQVSSSSTATRRKKRRASGRRRRASPIVDASPRWQIARTAGIRLRSADLSPPTLLSSYTSSALRPRRVLIGGDGLVGSTRR